MSSQSDCRCIRALAEAAERRNREAVDHEVAALAERLPALDEDAAAKCAADALAILRRKRYFPQMCRIAEAALLSGTDAPHVHRQYAQALIEQGLLEPALKMLESLSKRDDLIEEELEVGGLIGRANKDRFLRHPEPASKGALRSLERAVRAYYDVYRKHRGNATWHGVNAAALLHRAQRHEIAVPAGLPSAEEIARAVLEDVQGRKQRTAWDAATAAEAHLASGEYEKAAGWLKRYVSEVDADAFEFASTLRQFRQVWELDKKDPEPGALLVLLEANLLRAEGGQITGGPGYPSKLANLIDRDAEHLEQVFGEDQYKTIDWYKRGLRCAESVARIKRKLGNTIGTGFLVPGGFLHVDWKDSPLLVTNFHVVNRDGVSPGRRPQDLEVTFDEQGSRTWSIRDVLWQSRWGPVGEHPPTGLDTVILALDGDPDWQPAYERARQIPTGGQRIFVLGHPRGQELAFTLHDNVLVGASDALLHYRSPTRHGSSGSPLFNEDWELVGLHHGGRDDMPSIANPDDTYEANEGFSLDAIRQSVRTEERAN